MALRSSVGVKIILVLQEIQRDGQILRVSMSFVAVNGVAAMTVHGALLAIAPFDRSGVWRRALDAEIFEIRL